MGLAFILLIVGLVLIFAAVKSIVGLIFLVCMSAGVAFLADAMIPGKQLGGFLPAAGAGILGSGLGVMLIGHKGPILFGVPLVPGFLGSLILVALISWFQRSKG